MAAASASVDSHHAAHISSDNTTVALVSYSIGILNNEVKGQGWAKTGGKPLEALQPSKEKQEDICSSILNLPYTPITGGVLNRQGPMLLVPNTSMLSFRAALACVAPPVEDGERCHICDAPAVTVVLHIAWCECCVCTIFHAQGMKVIGTVPKRPVAQHNKELLSTTYRRFHALLQCTHANINSDS